MLALAVRKKALWREQKGDLTGAAQGARFCLPNLHTWQVTHGMSHKARLPHHAAKYFNTKQHISVKALKKYIYLIDFRE